MIMRAISRFVAFPRDVDHDHNIDDARAEGVRVYRHRHGRNCFCSNKNAQNYRGQLVIAE